MKPLLRIGGPALASQRRSQTSSSFLLGWCLSRDRPGHANRWRSDGTLTWLDQAFHASNDFQLSPKGRHRNFDIRPVYESCGRSRAAPRFDCSSSALLQRVAEKLSTTVTRNALTEAWHSFNIGANLSWQREKGFSAMRKI
jgi:hypothetical protein